MSVDTSPPPPPRPVANGAAWAALLSAAIGGGTFAVLTDLSEASRAASGKLQWYGPAGSLSGVAIGSVVIWAGVWAGLHVRWRGRTLARQRTLLAITGALVVLSLVATFPPFYELL